MKDITAARALGWTSLAIAATEIFGQGTVEKNMLGIDEHPVLMRSLGLREMLAGVTILSQQQITSTLAAGLWSRVAGDALDLALLAVAAPGTRRKGRFLGNALTVLGITALDIFYASRVQRRLADKDGTSAQACCATSA